MTTTELQTALTVVHDWRKSDDTMETPSVLFSGNSECVESMRRGDPDIRRRARLFVASLRLAAPVYSASATENSLETCCNPEICEGG